MERYKIYFNDLDWQSPVRGMRFKSFRQDSRQLRLVEFAMDFIEPEWCEKGHAGYVLEGILEIDFHGNKVSYQAGDGLLIPAGQEHGHKARSLTPITRLVLFENI